MTTTLEFVRRQLEELVGRADALEQGFGNRGERLSRLEEMVKAHEATLNKRRSN